MTKAQPRSFAREPLPKRFCNLERLRAVAHGLPNGDWTLEEGMVVARVEEVPAPRDAGSNAGAGTDQRGQPLNRLQRREAQLRRPSGRSAAAWEEIAERVVTDRLEPLQRRLSGHNNGAGAQGRLGPGLRS